MVPPEESNGNNNNTTLTNFLDYEKTAYAYCVPPMLIFCLISLIINVKVLMCVFWIRRPLSPVLMTSVSLAVADACTSAFLGVGLFLNSYLDYVYDVKVPRMVVVVSEVVRLSGCLVTVAHLFALSVNHYLGIYRPLYYQTVVTTRRVLTTLIMLWVCPTTFIAIYFLLAADTSFWYENIEEESFMDRLRFRMIFSSMFFVPFVLMAFFYVHILFIVHRQQKLWSQLSRSGSMRWKAYKTSKQSVHSEQRQMEGNVRAIKTTLLILGSCVLGWIPAMITYPLMCKVDCPIHGTFLIELSKAYSLEMFCFKWLESCFLILKTLVNPIIYTARMKEIQDGTERMHTAFLKYLCGRTSNDVNTRGHSAGNTSTSQEKKTSIKLLKKNGSIRHRSGSPTDLLNTLL